MGGKPVLFLNNKNHALMTLVLFFPSIPINHIVVKLYSPNRNREKGHCVVGFLVPEKGFFVYFSNLRI